MERIFKLKKLIYELSIHCPPSSAMHYVNRKDIIFYIFFMASYKECLCQEPKSSVHTWLVEVDTKYPTLNNY